MGTQKSLLLAVLSGCCIGGVVYRYLLADWFFVMGIIALYIGISYFILTYDITLLGEQLTFEDRYNRLGHAIGIFGLATTPLALIEYVDLQSSEAVGVLVWSTGTIAYLLIASAAQDTSESEG